MSNGSHFELLDNQSTTISKQNSLIYVSPNSLTDGQMRQQYHAPQNNRFDLGNKIDFYKKIVKNLQNSSFSERINIGDARR